MQYILDYQPIVIDLTSPQTSMAFQISVSISFSFCLVQMVFTPHFFKWRVYKCSSLSDTCLYSCVNKCVHVIFHNCWCHYNIDDCRVFTYILNWKFFPPKFNCIQYTPLYIMRKWFYSHQTDYSLESLICIAAVVSG